ncbi:MAG: hypothetical protein K0R17_1969 [Rariglobus sp.]|jgi:hypothetical protein|nr:hypothetical protein [Rariglobus sp.]
MEFSEKVIRADGRKGTWQSQSGSLLLNRRTNSDKAMWPSLAPFSAKASTKPARSGQEASAITHGRKVA